MTTAKQAALPLSTATPTALWINRGLEGLWLLAVMLVPIVFFSPERFLSEAVISYVQVPKIALLRTLVALMAILWLVEWGLKGQLPLVSYLKSNGLRIYPRAWFTSLAGWLREHPSRWVVLAVWAFLVATILSTLFSTSFSVSMWGEVPGQDSLAAYNVVTYAVLFGIITTHLKTASQLWRLLGAIVAVGVMISGYSVLQYFGHDFLVESEATGGGRSRMTSLMGNAVFAGAAMLLPIGVSLLLAPITLSKLAAKFGTSQKIWPRAMPPAFLALWTLVLAVQFLGLIYTFSRGPWVGAIIAIAMFLAMAVLFVGWRTWGWAILTLSLAGGVTWGVLQGAGTGVIFSAGPWAGIVVAVAGFLLLIAFLGRPQFLRLAAGRLDASAGRARRSNPARPPLVAWASLAVGVAAVAVVSVFIALPFLDGGAAEPGDPVTPPSRSTSAVQQRFSSITDEVLSGGFSGRGLHWQDSWRVGRDRPWFEFETLSLPWLRPIIGYGPDMFRYTYLLESSPQGGRLLPTEPDHAHNFFINHWVEQGILGLLASLALFGAVFAVGSYQLSRHRADYSDVHKLVLIGLVAVMAGRFVEQIVGLARVSDLTMFWALLAAFVVLPAVMRPTEPLEPTAPRPSSPAGERRERRRSRSRTQKSTVDWQRFVALALVAWAIGGIIAVTWIKTINYPRAGLEASQAVDRFHRGDFQGALAGLDRAIALAPDVPTYYSFKSSILAAYLQEPDIPPHPECSQGVETTPYDVCIGQQIFLSNLTAVQQRPYYWRSRLALANSALALGLNDEAIRLYREVVAMVPNSWPLLNRLAEAYIEVGQPEMALAALEKSLAITGDANSSSEARELQEQANELLANPEGSIAPTP